MTPVCPRAGSCGDKALEVGAFTWPVFPSLTARKLGATWGYRESRAAGQRHSSGMLLAAYRSTLVRFIAALILWSGSEASSTRNITAVYRESMIASWAKRLDIDSVR